MARMKMFSDIISTTLSPPKTRQLPGIANFGFRTELGMRSFRPLVQFKPRMPGVPAAEKPLGSNRNVYRSQVDKLLLKM